MEKVDGDFQGHIGCITCSSSDGLGIYRKYSEEKEDYYYDGHCFASCGFISNNFLHKHLTDDEIIEQLQNTGSSGKKGSRKLEDNDKEYVEGLKTAGWKSRGIIASSYKKYGVKTSQDNQGKIDKFYYPVRDDDGNIVDYKVKGYKKKENDKGKMVRPMYSMGSTKMDKTQLFGQHLFESGGRILILCEGEDEAVAWWQVLHENSGGKYNTPCVSVGYGAGNALKHVKANYQFVTSFEKVIIAFDHDKAGEAAAEEVLKVLKPGQGYKVTFKEHKDACEYLGKGKNKQLVDLFFRAEKFSPIDICTLGQLWDEFEQAVEDDIIELPPEFSELASKMGGGIAHGEVTIFGALTSIGKSAFINRIGYHAAMGQNKKVGMMPLESSAKEIVGSFLSQHINRNLALVDKEDMDMEKLKFEFKDMIRDDDKFLIVKHDGAFRNIDEMIDKLRWMTKAGDCDLLIVDPLQAAVPDNSNEMLDNFMDSMLKLAKESNTAIIVVSHMKKPEGDNPHAVSEYNLKGSSSINQIAFNTILLSRDKNSDDPRIRNTTKLSLPKCRRTGDTGDAGWIYYEAKTSQLYESPNPYESSEGPDDGLFDDDSFGDHPSDGGETKQKNSEESSEFPTEPPFDLDDDPWGY